MHLIMHSTVGVLSAVLWEKSNWSMIDQSFFDIVHATAISLLQVHRRRFFYRILHCMQARYAMALHRGP